MEPLIAACDVNCSRVIAGHPAQVLDLTVKFERAALNIIFGREDSGKDLLLRLLGLMERPDSGEVVLHGESTREWTDDKFTETRNRQCGFVFEAPFLLPSFSVQENIVMPLFKLTGAKPDQIREQLVRVLKFVGLADFADSSAIRFPLGWQIRVALARALVTKPGALFVENLDTLLRDDDLIEFLCLLAQVPSVFGTNVFVTALNRDLVAYGNRAIEMAGGRIISDRAP